MPLVYAKKAPKPQKTDPLRSETGRFEASIHPFNYPGELEAISDFDGTPDSWGLPLKYPSSEAVTKTGYFY